MATVGSEGVESRLTEHQHVALSVFQSTKQFETNKQQLCFFCTFLIQLIDNFYINTTILCLHPCISVVVSVLGRFS